MFPLTAVKLTTEGIEGDRHFGATRVIPGYESKDLTGSQVLTGTVVNNDKPLSFVSEADMQAIAEGLELPLDSSAHVLLVQLGSYWAVTQLLY